MKISQKGIDTIKEFEGCVLTAYYDAVNVLTIGYGHTGPDVYPNKTITKQEAEDILRRDLNKFEDGVTKLVKVKLTQNQFDALVSFSFNVGLGALAESTLLRKLNSGDYEGAAREFDRWVKGDNGPLPGLVRRRDAEESLFRQGGTNTGTQVSRSIMAFQNTYLKKEPVASNTLKSDQKVEVQTGKTYNIVWQSEVEDNHIKVSLAGNAGNWYIFVPHWVGLGLNQVEPKPQPVKGSRCLNVPYYSQRDNYRDSSRTCFSSSCAMLLKFIKPNAIKGDDDYIRTVFSIGDTTDSSVQVKALAKYGVTARFTQSADQNTLRKQIDKNVPIPIGILHHGSSSSPSGGGHWIIVIGYEEDKNAPGGGWFIVNDPWGELDNGSGTYVSNNGKELKYSYSMIRSRWEVEGPGTGWAILV